MSYENEKLMNLEDGRELLKVLDGKKANADSMFLYKSALPGSVVEVEDAVAERVKQMQIEIAPVQDLHGYDKPWVGGAGKNLLDASSAATGTEAGVTYTVTKNNDGSVAKIVANGTSSGTTGFYLCTSYEGLPAGDYVATAGSEVSSNGLLMTVQRARTGTPTQWYDVTSSSGASFSVQAGDKVSVYLRASASNVSINNVTVYPMIRSASVTDASFEPYSNICPISGHTGCEIVRSGKNLLSGVESGNYTGTGGKTDTTTRARCVDYIPVREYSEYTINAKPGNTAKTLQIYVNYHSEKGVNRISTTSWVDVPYTFTPPTGTKYILIGFRYSDNSNITASEVLDAQIEVGTKATQYTPFVGNSVFYNVQFPSPTPGTVYGGTLTLNQDGTGTLVVDRAGIDLGSIDWGLSGANDSFLSSSAPSGIKIPSAQTHVTSTICSQYPASAVTDQPNFTLSIVPSGKLKIYDSRFNLDATAFKTAMNGVVAVYPLAASTTYTLSIDQVRLLLGYNALYASTGSILSMLYPASQVEAVSNAKADGILETSSTPSAVMSFSDGADGIPMGVEVAIEPVQDLHGYDKPWVGGAGKNIAKPSVNPGTYTPFTGVTVVVNDDYSVKVSGTYAGNSFGRMPISQITLPAGTYIFNGQNNCDSTNKKLTLQLYSITASDQIVNKEDGNDYTFTLSAETQLEVAIGFRAGCSVTNQVMYPMIRLSTVSDATYEPYENICPISGFDHAEITRTGKNLWDKSNNETYLIAAIVDGIITRPNDNNRTIVVKCKPNTTYTISKLASNRFRAAYTYKEPAVDVSYYGEVQSDSAATLSITTDANAKYLIAWVWNSSGSVTESNMKDSIQVEEGSAATTYEPFGQTYSITFPTSAGTVYGGTLKVNKDGSGVLVVDRANHAFDGTENILLNQSAGKFKLANSFGWLRRSLGGIGICNMLGQGTSGDYYFDLSDNIYFAWASCADTTAMKAKLAELYANNNPLVMSYTLIETITYNIPAPIIKSLLGQNNVWASTGNVNSAEWSADTKSYIDNLFSSITSAEGQTF